MKRGSILSWLYHYRLEAIVFVTGAAILVIEIAATRILSPFYGNTIYTVSSVISVILAALSVGYWRGGKRADAKPTFHEFYRIIFSGGISLFALFILSLTVLPAASDIFSAKSGPLVWSMLLFFMPGYLLGMLSPFAIKLGHELRPHMGLGSMSGNIFFWSTAGSIVGSLLAGFVLIPNFGISAILYGTTALIAMLGGLGKIATSTGGKRRDAIFFLFVLLVAVTTAFVLMRSSTVDPRVRYVKDGIYEKLTVIDTMYAGRPARFFLQDKGTSGGMFLDGKGLAFDYTKYYALYHVTAPQLSRALVIGGGIYTIPKSILEERPNAVIDVAEIEPNLETIAKEYFDLPDTPNIRTHIMDGRRYLREHEDKYDLIFSDVYYSLFSIPTHFTTVEFFESAKSRLTTNGIFVANIIGAIDDSDESLLFSEIRTIKKVFPSVHVFAAESATSTGTQNFIIVATADAQNPSFEERLGQSADPLLKELAPHLFPVSDEMLMKYDILTDDYAPVDHLVTRFISKQTSTKPAKKGLAKGFFSPFSGKEAMSDIGAIVNLGTRAIGTEGNMAQRELIVTRMKDLHIDVVSDDWTHVTKEGKEIPLSNIIARYNPEAKKRIILGTHYDSIVRAYRNIEKPNAYMPGANNSASGVALLLEAARVLTSPHATSTIGIEFVFFDGEEGETALGAGDKNWVPLGSSHFVKMLDSIYPNGRPDHAVIFDMVCDKNLGLYKEVYSSSAAKKQLDRFWVIGGAFAPRAFHQEVKHTVGDDHLPFIAADIPAFLVIDFEYEPWFNTTNDTPERCSEQSMTLIGETLLHYLSFNQ